MKKILFVLSLFVLFLCGCHEHTFKDEWEFDEVSHYHQADCGHQEIKDQADHSLNEEIILEATHFQKGKIKYTCNVCGYFKEVETDIIKHAFSKDYIIDEESHYFLCECGEKNELEEHTYEEGEVIVEATRLTDGLKKYQCEKCGYIKEEIIEAIGFDIDENNKTIYLVTTAPGNDASKSVGISWHCNNAGSYLVYCKDGENEFTKVEPNEEYWSLEESYEKDPYQNKRYVCTVTLNELEANTLYSYKVISEDISSKDFTFTTASNLSEYSFISFVDFQYSNNQKTIDLAKLFIEKNPSAGLITCSGDIADEGSSESSHRHLFDNGVFANSILAFGAGDHEYWGKSEKPYVMFKRPYSYNKLFNNPKNGCEGYLNSSYYFKYNTTLFVFLDCGDSNVSSANDMFPQQAKWLDNVLATESGYDFIVVCMHKSLYGDPDEDSTVRKFAPIFTEVFDKHQVDLVISGHDHEYSRTKPIINGSVKENGTVYLDLGQSGNKTRATGSGVKSSDLYDKYIDIKENNYSLGIIATVKDGKMLVVVRNQNYKYLDLVELYKKDR